MPITTPIEPSPIITESTKSALAEPCTLIIFGASGDLTRRKLLPDAISRVYIRQSLAAKSAARRSYTALKSKYPGYSTELQVMYMQHIYTQCTVKIIYAARLCEIPSQTLIVYMLAAHQSTQYNPLTASKLSLPLYE